MREAYREYSGARGFTPDEFRALTERIAGVSLEAFWRSAIEETGELEYAPALEIFRLRFKPASTPPADRPKAWLGATTRVDAGRLLVSQVRRQTPAFEAGLNVDDEVLAVDEVRVRPDKLEERLEQYAPGDRIAILLARRDRLLTRTVTLGAEPPKSWRLEAVTEGP
jgi:predicted metalloprotease with PDZ domain